MFFPGGRHTEKRGNDLLLCALQAANTCNRMNENDEYDVMCKLEIIELVRSLLGYNTEDAFLSILSFSFLPVTNH